MKVVDLFSGCGGLSLGFEVAGYEIVKAFDKWTPAVKTYRANFLHPIEQVSLQDVEAIPECDVIVGGPPCQGFSSAGLRRIGDVRNSLVGEFARLVANARPRAFVFENVEGFITAEAGNYLFDLLRPLIDAGYRLHVRKVNMSNYGVPQHRKRVVVVGGLYWDPSFHEETHATFAAPGAHLVNKMGMPVVSTFAEAIAGLPPAKPRNLVEENDLLDHNYSEFSEGDRRRASHLREGQRMRDLPEELWHNSYRRRAYRRVCDGTPMEQRGGAPSGLRRLVAAEPSKAITGGALREFVHPSEDRPLTLRECARLQTFPDSFLFEGTMGEKCQQIGNAVPPRFAEVIARNLLFDLKAEQIRHNSGKLLSFVPTNSVGMSPVLKQVVVKVGAEYAADSSMRQGELCL